MFNKSSLPAGLKFGFFRFLWMFAYLFMIFFLFRLHEYLVLAEEGIPYPHFGISLIKALVLAKVMLIADELRLGHMSPNRPLLYPILRRSVLIALVLIALNIVEEIIKTMIKSHTFVVSIPAAGSASLLDSVVTAVILAFMLIPFFGYMEIGRAIGFENLRLRLFNSGTTPSSTINESTQDRKS